MNDKNNKYEYCVERGGNGTVFGLYRRGEYGCDEFTGGVWKRTDDAYDAFEGGLFTVSITEKEADEIIKNKKK